MHVTFREPLNETNLANLSDLFGADVSGEYALATDGNGVVYALVVLDSGEVLSAIVGHHYHCGKFHRLLQKWCTYGEKTTWTVEEWESETGVGHD